MSNDEKKSSLRKVFWTGYNILAFLIGIALTGFALNFFWYLFHALVLGWGDSGPDWYIDIQWKVLYGIFLGAAMLWLGGAWGFRSRNRKKREPTKEHTC